jgi:5-formyltetrahydrofolate cyclo-ligase
LQAGIQKTLDTKDDPSVSMSDWVMVHKVRKHLADNNQRRAASYVAMRLEEDSAPLSRWASEQMRKTPLQATQNQVLFTNEEGVSRAFGFVRAR